jgi:hypothetical protein
MTAKYCASVEKLILQLVVSLVSKPCRIIVFLDVAKESSAFIFRVI